LLAGEKKKKKIRRCRHCPRQETRALPHAGSSRGGIQDYAASSRSRPVYTYGRAACNSSPLLAAGGRARRALPLPASRHCPPPRLHRLLPVPVRRRLPRKGVVNHWFSAEQLTPSGFYRAWRSLPATPIHSIYLTYASILIRARQEHGGRRRRQSCRNPIVAAADAATPQITMVNLGLPSYCKPP